MKYAPILLLYLGMSMMLPVMIEMLEAECDFLLTMLACWVVGVSPFSVWAIYQLMGW